MNERQSHGFEYEEKYIQENGLINEEKYTSSWDAYDKDGIPYQIKCIKEGSSIDMGDYFINSEKNVDFFLVISFWRNNKSNIVKTFKLFIKHEKWKNFLDFEFKDKLKDWIKNKVSNSYSYDKQWKEEMKQWKDLWGDRKIQLRFKRDHSSQRRIQCAINQTDFNNFFVKEFLVE
jgi:hypothetical protein